MLSTGQQRVVDMFVGTSLCGNSITASDLEKPTWCLTEWFWKDVKHKNRPNCQIRPSGYKNGPRPLCGICTN